MEEPSPYLSAWIERRRAASSSYARAAAAVEERLPEAARCLAEEFAVTRVVLFGSLLSGELQPRSDVDLAVWGLAPERYFKALARVSTILEQDVDLVDVETARPSLLRHIEATGRPVLS